MRTLSDHVVPGDSVNHQLRVKVLDDPGQGGASHAYVIEFDGPESFDTDILFQNGPIKEFGVNGVTHEALLAIVIDRLRSFQDGPFKCRENALALTHLEDAMHWLQSRTVARIRRGVEGTHKV